MYSYFGGFLVKRTKKYAVLINYFFTFIRLVFTICYKFDFCVKTIIDNLSFNSNKSIICVKIKAYYVSHPTPLDVAILSDGIKIIESQDIHPYEFIVTTKYIFVTYTVLPSRRYYN